MIPSNFVDFSDNENKVLGVCNKSGISYETRVFNQSADHAEQGCQALMMLAGCCCETAGV